MKNDSRMLETYQGIEVDCRVRDFQYEGLLKVLSSSSVPMTSAMMFNRLRLCRSLLASRYRGTDEAVLTHASCTFPYRYQRLHLS